LASRAATTLSPVRRRLPRPLALASVSLAALVAVLTSCGGGDEGSRTTTETTTGTIETTETTTETTETTTDEQPPGPVVMRIVVENGVPKGGIVREKVSEGDRVVLVVRSDVADEVHLHGYDVSRDVEAGGTARLPFRATVPGRFEVELEERGVPIAELTVEP
jgi:hypothetical protein